MSCCGQQVRGGRRLDRVTRPDPRGDEISIPGGTGDLQAGFEALEPLHRARRPRSGPRVPARAAGASARVTPATSYRIADASRASSGNSAPRFALMVKAPVPFGLQNEGEGVGSRRHPQHREQLRDSGPAGRDQASTQTERIDHGRRRAPALQDLDFGADPVLGGKLLHQLRKIDLLQLEPEDAGRLVDPGREQGVGSAQGNRELSCTARPKGGDGGAPP